MPPAARRATMADRKQGSEAMSGMEVVFLVAVIAAFGVFGGSLAWAMHMSDRRQP